jgi:hypothetical protein
MPRLKRIVTIVTLTGQFLLILFGKLSLTPTIRWLNVPDFEYLWEDDSWRAIPVSPLERATATLLKILVAVAYVILVVRFVFTIRRFCKRSNARERADSTTAK